ncbi:RNA methyltransferase [Bordetella genomosp. 9]|uniref:THUMP domain-containing class I SAM-dependent RNA methyltransferase n=1 Tax=Bordetella genomosp. 9 TaxID=1416803 RepID=UPI000A291F38|nr:THUMP domain-containing protein [Bordetella genomosp. 9]ARP91267.1 RNA methyltransferase [Bordetella genomosp. 9]
MSADDSERPRKTLTLARRPDDAARRQEADKRKRAGGRARHVAQQEKQRDKAARLDTAPAPPAAGPSDPPARDKRDERRSSRSGPARPHRSDTASAPSPANNEDANARFAQRPDRAPRRARGSASRDGERFQVFAPCPQGLEEALTVELRALGYDDARAGRAGAHFSADWAGVQRANLYSRLATRILVQVAQAPVQTEDDLLDLAYATPWERWFGAERTLRVDTSAIKSPMRSLQYCNLRVKDGICDRLMDREGARPDIDTVRPDARVHAFLTVDTATLYLDTSGESLFKRGWRLDKGEAPLRENLAAGMLALADWDPGAPLLDPFCGSGTILIEAAWIALGVPPGIARPFSFERLRDHDARRWQDIKEDARAHIAPRLETPLFGYDIDPQAIEHARRNAERAWLTEDAIRFEVGDARTLAAPADTGWIVTNPPYGERLQSGHDESLWRDWAACLKRNFAGWQVHAISSDMTLPQQMRLKPLRRIPLHNGPLDCRLFGFELVSASYRDKRSPAS